MPLSLVQASFLQIVLKRDVVACCIGLAMLGYFASDLARTKQVDAPEVERTFARVPLGQGGTIDAVCRRYDVPASLCLEARIEGDEVVLPLEPEPE